MPTDDAPPASEVAARTIVLIDATNLADDCTDDDVRALCRAAAGDDGSHPAAAAVCVYPQFVELARGELPDDVHVATVVNFPAGTSPVDEVVAETQAALAAGADEIDVVLPYRAFLEGRPEEAAAVLDGVRAAVPAEDGRVKVIIESGALPDRAAVDAAARFAADHGADFVKTSTGKIAVSATPEAAETILGVLSTVDRPIGIKIAGGVRTLDDAAQYLELADRIMGDGWASPDTFRFGSSSLVAVAAEALATPDEPDEVDEPDEPVASEEEEGS